MTTKTQRREEDAARLDELKNEDWPRFSLDHIRRDTGLYNVLGRSGPIGRDLSKAAAEDLARVSGCTVEEVPISAPARALLSAAEHPPNVPAINAYLKHFVPGECPSCGYGRFSWGIVHGTGSCACGWPGTLYHFIDLADGSRLRVETLLWAHPYDVHVHRKRSS